MSVEQSLAQFSETESAESFSLQNSKLLKVELSDVTIQAKLGSMVAYQGDVRFEHAGSGETIQVGFSGSGWVLIQPSEGRVAGATSGASKGASGALGNLLGG